MSKRIMLNSAFLLAFGGLALLFFYQLVFTNGILARGDTFAYFYPYWEARDSALANGNLPLWTPHLFMGVPLMANSQLGTFYPPNWLTIAQDAPQAIKIHILLHSAWAGVGAFFLARIITRVGWVPALIAGGLFGFGGHIGAHVEQINQLQGLSWMPWLFLLLHLARVRPGRYLPLLAIAWALQILSGHTQTVFISGIGLGVYVLAVNGLIPASPQQKLRRIVRDGALLAVGALIAVILALPQLLPAQELASLSNRADGLNAQEATAFSWNPALIGRGLLPSYDAQPFAEYLAYIGIIGLGLALIGAFATRTETNTVTDNNPPPNRVRLVWVILALIGLVFALGRFTPVYLALANLPGFNLFRVPARWLVLFALSASMLAGLGTHALLYGQLKAIKRPYWAGIVSVIGGLMALTLLADRAQAEVNGGAIPTMTSWIGWGVALVIFGVLVFMSTRQSAQTRRMLVGGVLIIAVFGELWLASHTLPYNDLADPRVFEPRFAAYQLQAYGLDDPAPERMLSISGLLFDPGDRPALEARWDAMGLSERGADYAFTATKMQETLAGNLPLLWQVPSIDGFDGGVLPTIHYTAFTSLMLPEGALRTIDGRLREILAQPDCRGACLPDDRWLDLTNTRYLLMDKVYDRVVEGIFYDTAHRIAIDANDTYTLTQTFGFEANAVHLLMVGDCTSLDCDAPQVAFNAGNLLTLVDRTWLENDNLTLLVYRQDETTIPDTIAITARADTVIQAVTLVDERVDLFLQLAPNGWERVYSADIKIFENLDVLPRAFVVHDAVVLPDSWAGTESALNTMRGANFDPSRTITINTDDVLERDLVAGESTVEIASYTATEVILNVTTGTAGWLLLTDAYYPGWQATVNGADAEVYRADVMFRAVQVPAGDSTVMFTYRPFWLPIATPAYTWVLAGIMLLFGIGLSRNRVSE